MSCIPQCPYYCRVAAVDGTGTPASVRAVSVSLRLSAAISSEGGQIATSVKRKPKYVSIENVALIEGVSRKQLAELQHEPSSACLMQRVRTLILPLRSWPEMRDRSAPPQHTSRLVRYDPLKRERRPKAALVSTNQRSSVR